MELAVVDRKDEAILGVIKGVKVGNLFPLKNLI